MTVQVIVDILVIILFFVLGPIEGEKLEAIWKRNWFSWCWMHALLRRDLGQWLGTFVWVKGNPHALVRATGHHARTCKQSIVNGVR